MLCSCWSAKGGVGTTVVSVSLAVLLAGREPGGALLVDLAGDAPAALGVAEPQGPGLAEWLSAGDDVPVEALGRLEVEAGPGLSLLPTGNGSVNGAGAGRCQELAAWLASQTRPVVVDCGVLTASPAATVLAGAATRSLLVTRACYLGMRRVVAAPVRPSGVVLLVEPGRAMGRGEVERVVGAPVQAEVMVDPAVARAVDSGMLGSRLPRGLVRSLRGAA